MMLGGLISVSVNLSNTVSCLLRGNSNLKCLKSKFYAKGQARYFQFVSITGIVVALIFMFLNFVNLVDKFRKVPWNLIVFNNFIFWMKWKIFYQFYLKGNHFWSIVGDFNIDCRRRSYRYGKNKLITNKIFWLLY